MIIEKASKKQFDCSGYISREEEFLKDLLDELKEKVHIFEEVDEKGHKTKRFFVIEVEDIEQSFKKRGVE